jgi:hypothetical protein
MVPDASMQMYTDRKVPLLRSFGSQFRDDNHYGHPSQQAIFVHS